MTLSKLADMIITKLAKAFYRDGKETTDWNELFVEFALNQEELYQEAVELLVSDRLVEISYTDDTPCSVQIKPAAIKKEDENTWLIKGYGFMKEIREWL